MDAKLPPTEADTKQGYGFVNMKNRIAIKLALVLVAWFGLPVQAERVPDPQIYVFISASMTESNLIALATEAKARGVQTRGVQTRNVQLVLRGLLNNSFEETVKFLANMIRRTGQGVLVDPTLFKDYNVIVVPTFVVTNGSEESPVYNKIAGNISLAAALQKMGNL